MPDHAKPSPSGGAAGTASTPPDELRILLLEDHAPDAERIERELVRNNLPFKLRRVMTRDAFRRELVDFHPSVILADYALPDINGLEAILLARQAAPGVPFLVVTASIGDEAAASCMQAGAQEYVLKERLNRLVPAIANAIGRGRAANEASTRQQHAQELLDALPEGIVELDAEDRIRYANRRFCELLGYTQEELVGRRGPEVLVNGEVREQGVLRRAGVPDRFEIAVHKKSGEPVWIELSATPLLDAQGVPHGSLGVVRDISTRKQSEQVLWESEVKYYAAFHESPFPMSLRLLEGGEYTDVNERFLEIVGLGRDDVVGHTSADLGFRPEPGEWTEIVGRIEREGRIPALETALRTPSMGERIWRSSLQRVRFGSRDYVLSVIEDVTDRRRAEEQLADTEQRFAMFSASAFEGIAITEATRIVDANEQLARMLGLTSGEMVGREMLDFIAPDSRERAAAMLREGSLPVDEFFLLRKDGTVFPVEAQGRSFLYRGSPVRVTTIRDITVRREHEALLNGQRAVLEMIAKGMPLGETLDTLLRVIETQWPDMLCSILLLDPDGMHLRHAAAPNLPGEYLRAIDGASIGEGAGSCGTAAHRGEQVIVEDIAADPLWADYRGLALPHGLRACWSTPIFDPQHRVLGTFAMYYRTPRRPGAEHVRLVETVTHTAAIAILRHDREQALRLSEEKFSRAFRVSPDSITISRIEDGRFIEANEGFERMSGYSRAEAMGRTAIELGLWQNSGQRAKLLDGLRELGSVRDMDFDFTVKGGAVLACLVSAEKITVNGEECLLATTRDVTERKRAEETLRRTSTQMMELLARVTDGFVALDKEWRYVYVNPNAALMFGRDQASLLGKHIWTEFPEGVGEKFHLAYEEAMRDQQAKSIEAYYPPWKKWYENRIYPSPHGLSIYFRDITESKRAEALLRESELRYQNLLQSVEGIVWEADAATLRFTFASHQAERLLGYPVGQWLDEPSFWSEHLHPEDRAWAVESRKRQMQGEEPHAVEYRMISADGRVVWLRDIVSAIVDDHEPLYLRGLMIDITEQMLANEALRRSEAKFRAVAETATAAIFVYRGDEFAYVNAGAASITGYETGELAATKLSQIVHPDFHELVRGRGDLRVLGEETPSRYELKLVTKSGEERWVDFSTGLMEFDGKTAALGIAFDVTARKLAEEQLQHTTEQLRALSAHLQSVREEEQIRISREIHDQLGQAMTGLRMDVSWITKRLGADQPELVDRVEGMKSLIDETIQMVRRISSELRPGVLDNLGLIPAIDWQVKEFRTRTSIACELHLPDDSPVLSTESATAVFRIFQETLTNVARHSGADRVTVTITVHAGTLILEVADNGKGISPGDIGKSLGLVGMRERAMAVGGSVSVTGEPAKGTTVVLRVPLQRPAASPAK